MCMHRVHELATSIHASVYQRSHMFGTYPLHPSGYAIRAEFIKSRSIKIQGVFVTVKSISEQ